MDAISLKKLAQRRQMRRKMLAALPGIDTVLPDSADMLDEASRKETATKLAKFVKDFQLFFKQLLNNVRANLQQELAPFFSGVDAVSQISDLSQEEVSQNTDGVKKQTDQALKEIEDSAKAAMHTLITIRDECNKLILSLNR